MKIIIITRGRVGKQSTLANLPKEFWEDTLICCPPDERHDFGVTSREVENGLVLPTMLYEPWPMDYSQKFQWILDGADGQLSGKVVIMDDDLRFCVRDPANPTKLLSDDMWGSGLADGLYLMEELLDDYPLIGFHPRAMANNCSDGVMLNKRINAVQGLNLDLIGDVGVAKYPILADMFLNLTLLTRGQENALICGPYWDQVGTSNAPGGCSLHRTWEQQRDVVLGLEVAFPQFVTVKQKVVKNGWWGPDKPRYDFIIQWKKAAEYGQRNA